MGFLNFKNINKGWFTSLLGYLVICASLVSVFLKGTTWTEAAVGIGAGLLLLGTPDPKGPAAGMGVVGGVLLLIGLAFGGCASQKQLQAKYGTLNAPVTVAVSDTLKLPITVTTKPDSLSASFSLDSLADASSGDTLKLVSVGGLATMEVWKSPVTKVGGSQRLNARVKVPPQMIHDTIEKVVTLYAQCPPTWTMAPKVEPTRWQRYYGYYQEVCTAVMSVLLVVLLILAGFRLKRLLPFAVVLVVLAGAGSLGGCRAAKPMPKPKDQSSQSNGLPYWIKRDLHRNI